MKKKSLFKQLFLLVLFISTSMSYAQSGRNNATTIHPSVIKTPIGFEITTPLRDNPIVSDLLSQNEQVVFNNYRDRTLNPNITPPDFRSMPVDASVQNRPAWVTPATRALTKNYAGQNSGSYPPDANGAVNANYYFQVVNSTYAIYNKSDGSIAAGPSDLNTIFNSSLPGANCNSGDPIVLWDEHANKWFYAEFSLCNSNKYMLIAVSQTADPTGSWWSWSFDVDDTPDYMKFGIWQDGYYMATNTSNGNDVYVFDRATMIAGGANPTMIGFDNPNRPSTFDGFHCILPLDNDGDWAPNGTPGQFITVADDGQSNPADALWIYELHTDWNNSANATFSRTQTINVNSFSGNFTGNWDNIPQQGTTKKLDAVSTVLMYRAQYRNFNGDQRLVIAHTIAESSDESALRWYELSNSGSGWSIRQQSTYNPDNVSRWNMSIAMNGNKEIAIGYSVSNANMHPGIRYIGQSATANAAANSTLDMTETSIHDGAYSQTNYNRWGDYCNMSVDPSDDTSFWYTNEYMGSSVHGTRIVSFKFSTPTGTAPIANFSADNVSPTTNQTVSFTDSSTNSPTSWSWSFSPNTVTYVNGTSATSQNPKVTFDAAGDYTVTLTATNAYGSDDEVKTNYISATVAGITYCASKGNTVTDEYIQRVQLNSIDNASGNGNGYSDFTTISTDLTIGQSYTITVTPKWTGTVYNEAYAVFIDYNHDGDFDDSGETVWTKAASKDTPNSGTFTIPSGASQTATRMRVSMKYNGIPTACETFDYGEVEDYTLNIVGQVVDTQAPSAPSNLTASNVTQTTVDLSWTASTDNVGVTAYDVYQDGSIIGSISGTTAQVTNLTANMTYAFYVKAKDAAGNISAASNTVNVTTLPESTGGCDYTVNAFPYHQGFENTIGNWKQNTNDDFDWTVKSGSTPSSNTGPSGAAEGSYYVYMESSSPNYSDKRAILTSPCFDLAGTNYATISFKYHMYGDASKMGSLALQVSTDNGANWSDVWSKSGNQGNAWLDANVDLNAYTGQTISLRFNGITGTTWQGDMAVDAFNMDAGTQAACVATTLKITFDNYPEETSWDIKDDNGNVVYSGGTYGSEPDGSTKIINMCIDTGCYTFTMKDAYGDGMCCSYGNGSYSFTKDSDGSVLASGGSFQSSEATNFCLNTNGYSAYQSGVHANMADISIFPNPADKFLMVYLKDKKMKSFRILNLMGQVVKQGTIQNSTIDVSQIKSGMYLINFNSGKKTIFQKFVKK